MKITHGLMTGQVLQRSAEGRGAANIVGRCVASGTVELRVRKAAKVVRGHDWAVVGAASRKQFSASLTALRTGGPYSVELRIKAGRKVADRLAIEEVFVGDVWMLAGQSNMEGIGNLVHAPKPHPQVRAFFMRDEWGMAEEKLHYLCEAVDKVHNEYGNEPGRPPKAELEKGRANLVKGTSPGLAFGIEMQRRTKVPQGVIPCAHGGTSMAQWSPELRDQGGASLYGAMMRRYEKLGQPIAGILWYQGESDANRDAAAVYTDKMVELVGATRRDMELSKLPWVIVQLGCHAAREDEASWNSIQEQQRLLPEVVKHLDVAPAIDLELDDGIHIAGKAQQVLGRRLARLADRLVNKSPGVKPGIKLKRVEIVPTPHSNVGALCSSVQITYANVAGKLDGGRRPAGFALIDQTGADIYGIYKTTLHGNRVLLHTNMPPFQLAMLSVSYGHGRYPVCTVTDREGMSIPGMQAVAIKSDHMPLCAKWQTTLLSGVSTLSKASLACIDAATGWRKAPPRAGFGVLPKRPTEDTTGVYAMRTTVKASEAVEALVVLGANAPFKMWIDGKLVLTDPDCTVPIQPGEYQASVKLKRGANNLCVAFAIPGPGEHLGICMQIGTPAMRREERVSC
ncbi:MAG: hypothetical protein HN919_03500 [Verrucomicrobia bacterium]|jgi:hypothetical protein|nr:hypothetical protein [Verrucomicrobiota bacterium]MBT7065344.1 hypothetical protein [Verrucomicrobiota bacterium]MBT7699026.1 hypothetical protein [Verrucomicrobiota bacterium]